MPTLIASAAPVTVGGLIQAIMGSGEVKLSGNENAEAGLRRALVRALSRLSSKRTSFTETEFSITTVNGQVSYGAGHSGFPRDAADFEVVEFDTGNGNFNELRQVPFPELRAMVRDAGNAVDPRQPRIFAWWDDQLHLGPAPKAAVTLRGWYHRDARRDAETGNLIDATPASDGFTNPWLSDGEDPTWNRVLEIYHLAFAVDAERAAFYASQFQDAMKALEIEWTRRGRPGLQTTAYW
jgi:hypothetical protein